MRPVVPLLAVLALASAVAAPRVGDDPRQMGRGEHVYEWVNDWMDRGSEAVGNTHGAVAVDAEGNVYANTDATGAVRVHAPDGTLLATWGSELAGGLHCTTLVDEADGTFAYHAHTGRHEVVKTTLDGEILWTLGHPESSGLYANAGEYRPTSVAVAPDGRIFVADGYGKSWVHVYDAERRYVRSIGGPGTAPGQFRTPHGVAIDLRGDEPRLLVADRENGRLQGFSLDGEHLFVASGMLRRPCGVQQQGDYLVVPDLAGRVTILDRDNELYCHLGDNPFPSQRANNGVAMEQWAPGRFTAPHGACWDADGNLYVLDWNRHGRVSKLQRIR